MMQLGPCAAGWSPAEIITAVGVAANSLLLTFLIKRRLAKDSLDHVRWSQNQLDHLSTKDVVNQNARELDQLTKQQ